MFVFKDFRILMKGEDPLGIFEEAEGPAPSLGLLKGAAEHRDPAVKVPHCARDGSGGQEGHGLQCRGTDIQDCVIVY